MKSKKLIAAIIAAAMALTVGAGLAACGDDNPGDNNNNQTNNPAGDDNNNPGGNESGSGSVYTPPTGKVYTFDHFEKYNIWMTNDQCLDWTTDDLAVAANTGSTITFLDDNKIDNYNPNLPEEAGDKHYTVTYKIEDGKYVITDWQGAGAVPMSSLDVGYFIVEENKVTFYEEVNSPTKLEATIVYTVQ